MNSSSVGARRDAAKESTNVPRHHFGALPFATAMDYVLRAIANIWTNIHLLCFCSLNAILILASVLQIVPLHSPSFEV